MIDDKPNCPYWDVPETSLWKQAVSDVALADVRPYTQATPLIGPETRVGSAGSCFAQHISRHLRLWDYNYYVTEPGPPWLSQSSRSELGYDTFSARYGNVYTARQLRQLIDCSIDAETLDLAPWELPGGGFADPLRPRVEPNGFVSIEECLRDRRNHLVATRSLFETLDVLVFTLGLTEGWRDIESGAMLPVCPGCGAGGRFDPNDHEFVNFTVEEVTNDLEHSVARLREINPEAHVILTVSPVPLAATFETQHVLPATVYSKSVLRVACETAVRSHNNVHYFASYEMVTSLQDPYAFLEDGRQVREDTVRRVMTVFADQFCKETVSHASDGKTTDEVSTRQHEVTAPDEASDVEEVLCDEDALVEALERHKRGT